MMKLESSMKIKNAQGIFFGIVCLLSVLSLWLGFAKLLFVNDLHAKENSSPSWRTVLASAPFSQRDGAGLVAFKDKIWLLGGWTGSDRTLSEVWSSSDGKAWNRVTAAAPWAPRHGAGFVVFADRIWVIGGDLHADIWSSHDGEHWELVLADAPWGKRYAPYVAVHDNKIWLMGGMSWRPSEWCVPDSPHCIVNGYNDVWVSEDGKSWVRVTDHAPWGPRGLIHGFVVMNDRLWVFGGGLKVIPPYRRLSETQIDYADVWSSKDGKDWILETKDARWTARSHAVVTTHDNRMWMAGGSVDTQFNLTNEVWSSADGRNWNQVCGTPWSPNHAGSLVSFKGELLFLGGMIEGVWALIPDAGECQPPSLHVSRASCSTISASWEDTVVRSGYRLYRLSDGAANEGWEVVAHVDGKLKSHPIEYDLTRYKLRLTAIDRDGTNVEGRNIAEIAFSEPAAPTLSYQIGGPGEVTLTVADAADCREAYVFYRREISPNQSDWGPLERVDHTIKTWTGTGYPSGASYEFTVIAKYAGMSQYQRGANTVTVTFPR